MLSIFREVKYMNHRRIFYSQMLDVLKMKISFEERYFSLNRIIMLATGLWPYQQSKLVQLQLAFFLSILLSFIVFQLSRLFYVERSFDFTIKSLCISSFFTFFAMNYITFWINIETVRYILERLQYIYNNLTDKNEIAIYDKYGNIAKRITFVFIIAELCSVLTVTALQTWSTILELIVPNNETYARHLKVILSKHFAVQEKYFYVVLLHLDAAVAVGSFALVAGATIMFSYIIHICGMFRIASYRLEQTMKSNTVQNISLKNEIIYRQIICAVDIHRKAMEFARFSISSMERSLFLIIMITVICVSFNLYRISQTQSPMEEIEEFSMHFCITTCTLLYLFFANFAGQEITDYNNDVFFTAYNVSWYLTPLHIQKLILFLLQRGSKAFTLTIGGLFTTSLECFASLTSASISYFTIMVSMQ